MGKNTIVIIDSGITATESITNEHSSINYADGNFVYDKNMRDTCNHGTAITHIISRHDPNANIININITANNKDATIRDLIDVLYYIYNNVNCTIVNISMSFNMIEDYDTFIELKKICQTLSESNVIIVSAFDNWGSISYPAAFDCVIGVISGDFCFKNNDIEFINDNVVNICGKGNNQNVYSNNGRLILSSGNSLACAHVTGVISNIITGKTYYKDVLNKLKSIAVKEHFTNKVQTYKTNPCLNFKKTALIMFNKEMHALVRYSDILPFDIVGVYDTKYSGLLGSSTNDILEIKNKTTYIINDISDINYSSIDSIVIGHVEELTKIDKIKSIIKQLTQKCIDYGIKIFSLDDIGLNSYKYYFNPNINVKGVYTIPFGKLYRISKPIIGVWGTSSNQGKFTLQLYLRKRFMQDNYVVGQIGTDSLFIWNGFLFSFWF